MDRTLRPNIDVRAVLKRIRRELNSMEADPLPYYSVQLMQRNMLEWLAHLNGPEDSPYEGGVFRIRLSFPLNYPYHPPKVIFQTKIYHPNINSAGEVCMGMLRGGSWSPLMGGPSILLSIHALLHLPEINDALVPSAARMYVHNRPVYNDLAKRTTMAWAKPPPLPYPTPTDSSSTMSLPARNGSGDWSQPSTLALPQQQPAEELTAVESSPAVEQPTEPAAVEQPTEPAAVEQPTEPAVEQPTERAVEQPTEESPAVMEPAL